MPVDMRAWFLDIKDIVAFLADEKKQRRSWFGLGPEASSPDEAFCSYFDDLAIEEYISRQDTNLTRHQLAALTRLTSMMRTLSNETPSSIDRSIGPDFIEDPRWKEIIKTAANTLAVL